MHDGVPPSLELDRTNLYVVAALILSVLATATFVLLSPGFLVSLPKKASIRTQTLVHALVFLFVFSIEAVIVAWGFKRLHNKKNGED